MVEKCLQSQCFEKKFLKKIGIVPSKLRRMISKDEFVLVSTFVENLVSLV